MVKKNSKIINNKFKSNKISINSIKTAKKFSWLDRCQKILNSQINDQKNYKIYLICLGIK